MIEHRIRRLEWIVAILLSSAVVILLLIRTAYAGPLWRDECGGVQLAMMPRISDILQNFQYQTFPPLFALIIRGYTALFGASDLALRSFGLAVGLGTIGIAWLNSRRLVNDLPLIFLALLGLNPTFLISGTSMRGYGVGSLLFLLALGLAIKAFRQANSLSLALVALACLASINCLANNVPLVGAMALSALIVLLLRRRFRGAILVSILTGLIALSFAPIARAYFAADWRMVVRTYSGSTSLLHRFASALGEPLWLMGSLWAMIAVLVLFLSVCRIRSDWRDDRRGSTNLVAFLVLFVGLSILVYYGFLKTLGYPTQSWYYLTFISALAGAIDLLSALVSRSAAARLMRLIFASIALIVIPFTLRHSIVQRATNMDVVATELQKRATPSDLIVVNPWYLGLSFQWHYRGHTPWRTIPAIDELRIHRYDLLKAAMEKSDPLADARLAIQQTLKSGNRVWIVGGARPPEPGLPLSLPPAPHTEIGWSGQAYVNVWSMQLGDFLQRHVIQGDVALPPAADVNPDENVPVLVAEGWQD